jgi:copper chaperone
MGNGNTVTTLLVEGMRCPHCSAAVARALREVEGVVSAEVDLEAGKARVVGGADLADLVGAVALEGFTARLA